MNYIIGISGKAGHGKDYLSDFLKILFLENMDRVYTKKIRFADKIKEFIADLLYVDSWHVYDEVGKNKSINHMGGVTGRKALQVIGTDIAREIYEDIWVFHYDIKVKAFLSIAYSSDNNCVIFTPDMRFQNEYDYIKNLHNDSFIDVKPILIRVIRPGYSIRSGAEHASEIGLDHIDQWDYRVSADNLVQLKERAEEIFRKITEVKI